MIFDSIWLTVCFIIILYILVLCDKQYGLWYYVTLVYLIILLYFTKTMNAQYAHLETFTNVSEEELKDAGNVNLLNYTKNKLGKSFDRLIKHFKGDENQQANSYINVSKDFYRQYGEIKYDPITAPSTTGIVKDVPQFILDNDYKEGRTVIFSQYKNFKIDPFDPVFFTTKTVKEELDKSASLEKVVIDEVQEDMKFSALMATYKDIEKLLEYLESHDRNRYDELVSRYEY